MRLKNSVMKLANHRLFRWLVFFPFWVVSKSLKLPQLLIDRAVHLNKVEGINYSCGLLFWLIKMELNHEIPDYNVYHLMGSDREKGSLASLCERHKGKFKARKQLYLLQQKDTDLKEVTNYFYSILEKALKDKSGTKVKKDVVFSDSLALEALKDCHLFFEKKLGVKCFLVSGTLLGLIRDNGFVEGDYDIDLGFFNGDIDQEQVYRELKRSLDFHEVTKGPHIIKAKHANGVKLDFFVHYKENGLIWHGSKIHRWYNSEFSLIKRPLDGLEFYIPDNPEEYLEENYGGWQHPVSYWNFSFDTPNQRFPKRIETLFYLTEVVRKRIDDRYFVAKALHALKQTFDIDLIDYLPADSAHPILEKLDRKKVIITFGTYDLFHIGHLKILERAAEKGDRLIVGVSGDQLNYEKKSEYPAYSETDRMDIVKAIGCVNEVFLEESLELKREYIKRFNADMLVMGDDWKGKFDHLNDICEVVYLPRTELISTTETKEKIIKGYDSSKLRQS